MKLLVLLLFPLLIFTWQASANPRCDKVLQNSQDLTNVISQIEKLAEFKVNLEQTKVEEPSSIALTALRHDFKMKERKLRHYLESQHIMSAQEMSALMKKHISELQRQKKQDAKDAQENSERERENKEIHTALQYFNMAKQKMVFHEIRPGEFMMGDPAARKLQAHVTLTKSYAMMSTDVTQMMWAAIKIALRDMSPDKVTPSENKHGSFFDIDGVLVEMKPDHPVTNVSWADVTEWILRLNFLSKSDNPKVQELLKNIIPDHQKGDEYDLPTDAQFEYVARNRGKAQGRFFDKDDDSELQKYAWYRSNSDTADEPNMNTHAVALLQPRLIDVDGTGNYKAFYDLEGNVTKICKDGAEGVLPGGIDPFGKSEYEDIVVRGGRYFNDSQFLKTHHSYGEKKYMRAPSMGFRLIRVRP